MTVEHADGVGTDDIALLLFQREGQCSAHILRDELPCGRKTVVASQSRREDERQKNEDGMSRFHHSVAVLSVNERTDFLALDDAAQVADDVHIEDVNRQVVVLTHTDGREVHHFQVAGKHLGVGDVGVSLL